MKSTEDIKIQEKNELIEQLFIEYSNLMFYISNKILEDKHSAEDAVQKAFLKLEKSNIKIDSVVSKKTQAFMIIVIKNISFTMLKSEKTDLLLYDAADTDEISDFKLQPLDIIINRETIAEVQTNLNRIDEKYGDIFLLKYFYGYSISEIAYLFEISEQLVRVRLYRARKLVLERIERESK